MVNYIVIYCLEYKYEYMAHQVRKKGGVQWWPDYYKAKERELLDPKKTPSDNLWETIWKVSCIWLNKARVWSDNKQDMEDLEQTVRIATYNRLLYIVRNGNYRREFSFWVNCTRSCWSIVHKCIAVWLDDIKFRHSHISDGDASIVNSEHGTLTLFDSLAAHKVPRLMTESDYYCNYLKRRWYEYDRPCDRTKALRAESYSSYEEYCEDCLLYNISDVLSYDDFVRQNYTLEERKIIAKPIYGKAANKAHDNAGRPRLSPDKYKAKLAYNREWYAKNKGRPRKPKKSIAELEPEQREERRSYYRDWYQRNREKLLAYNAEYRANNRERIRQYSRKWHQKQKDAN